MNKTIRFIKSQWHCLTSVGMADVDEKEGKYVKFANVIAALTAISVFLYIPFSMVSGYYGLALMQAIDVLCVLSVLLFNHLGYNKVARHSYIFIINGFVLINSCLIGFDSHVHDFFYIAYIVPFLMFSVKDYRNILVGVLMSIFFFNIYHSIYPHFVQYNLDANTQHVIYNINLWMKFVLFGIAIYILSYYNFSTEAELENSNLRLKEQAKELQRSNADLEQFASIISHDLKAPVRNVSSFMSIIRRKHGNAIDPEALSFVELSQTSADRMAKQIDDLLSYSKVGRNLPPSGPVDVNSVISTIRIELGERIRERNADIVVDRPMPILSRVHSSMIHHVFQNLIANGIKFNTNSEPKVKISYVDMRDKYVFCISDNGIGIDEIYKDKLFQMFKRLHSDSEFEGTGIGLAVCKKIVEFYGGSIWMESEPSKGSEFYFSLPRRRTEYIESKQVRTEDEVLPYHSFSVT